MKYILALIFLTFSALSTTSRAAEIFIKNKGNNPWLVLEGQIEEGDARRLISVIKSNPVDFIVLRGIIVNSPGGSVKEALALAKIIESSGMVLRVHAGDTCASACFIMFASANYRWADDQAKILIHRPYFPTAPNGSEEFSKLMRSQQEAIHEMRNYLQSRSVPSTLIDNMMSFPSNAAYEVTVQDVYERLGPMSPLLEELTMRKCGLTNANIFRRDNGPNGGELDIKCIDNVLIDLKNDWLKNLIGLDQFKPAHSEAMDRIYKN